MVIRKMGVSKGIEEMWYSIGEYGGEGEFWCDDCVSSLGSYLVT